MVKKLLAKHEILYVRRLLKNCERQMNFGVWVNLTRYGIYDGCVESTTVRVSNKRFLIEPNTKGTFKDGKEGAIWDV